MLCITKMYMFFEHGVVHILTIVLFPKIVFLAALYIISVAYQRFSMSAPNRTLEFGILIKEWRKNLFLKTHLVANYQSRP
jgi:hypothetical protein